MEPEALRSLYPRVAADRKILLPANSLVVLCGPAGSGKSTFAARHFSRTQVVSSDECRALISDDPDNQSVSSRAFDLMHLIIQIRLSLGRTTVADATHLAKDSRTAVARLARRAGFNATALVFDTPLQICLARNRQRERQVPETVVLEQHQNMRKVIASLSGQSIGAVFVLNQDEQDSIEIELVPAIRPFLLGDRPDR